LEPGCLIRGNLIHDTQGSPFGRLDQNFGEHPPSSGIYLDGDNSGCLYENNVLYRNLAAGPLIFNYESAEKKNTWLDNLFQKDGTPPQEFIEAMQALAGLEPAYQQSILKKEPNRCQYSCLNDPAAVDGWAAYQSDFPKKSRGVVEIIRREGKGDSAILKLRCLDVAARYATRGYAGNLGPSPVWGPGSMAMLSNVVPLSLSDLGLALGEGNTMSGRELVEQGMPMRLAKFPQVVWIAYQRLQ
jgi:hypothetical protein